PAPSPPLSPCPRDETNPIFPGWLNNIVLTNSAPAPSSPCPAPPASSPTSSPCLPPPRSPVDLSCLTKNWSSPSVVVKEEDPLQKLWASYSFCEDEEVRGILGSSEEEDNVCFMPPAFVKQEPNDCDDWLPTKM